MNIDENKGSIKRSIASPCIRNCCLDDLDICLGCFRSLTEITSWSELDDKQRAQVLINIENRKRD